MMRKAANATTLKDPKLSLVKPPPEPLITDAQALDRILSEGVSYVRELARDCLGGERATETVRFKVTLTLNNPSFGGQLFKSVLIHFLNERLGKPLSTVDRGSEELIEALQEADDRRYLHLKRVD